MTFGLQLKKSYSLNLKYEAFDQRGHRLESRCTEYGRSSNIPSWESMHAESKTTLVLLNFKIALIIQKSEKNNPPNRLAKHLGTTRYPNTRLGMKKEEDICDHVWRNSTETLKDHEADLNVKNEIGISFQSRLICVLTEIQSKGSHHIVLTFQNISTLKKYTNTF